MLAALSRRSGPPRSGPPQRSGGWSAVAWLVALLGVPVAVTVVLGEQPYAELNLNDPGSFTSIGTVALTAIATLAGLTTLGGLGYLLFLRPGETSDTVHPDAAPVLGTSRASALVWMVCSLLLVAFTAADTNGVPVLGLLRSGQLSSFVWGTPAAAAWCGPAVMGLVTYLVSRIARSWPAFFFTLLLGLLATLMPLVTGQVSVGRWHDIATDAAVLSSVVMVLWFGLAWILTIHPRPLDPQQTGRFRTVATIALIIMVPAQVVFSLYAMAGEQLWSGPYGWLLIAQALALLGLVVLAIVRPERRITLGWPLMWLWLTATVAASRVPPPRFQLPQTTAENFLGYSVDQAPTLAHLLGFGRLNLLFAFLAVVGAGLYLYGVIRLHRRGDRWPVGRTIAWLLGWLVIFDATSSGVGRFGPPSFSIHMVMHMTLNMFGPVLLVMGGPLTLALRVTRPAKPGQLAGLREWIPATLHSRFAQLVTHPLLIFVVFISSFYVLYFSPLFGYLMRFHWGHQAMNLHFVLVGYLFYWTVIGVDRPNRPLPHIAKLGFVFAAMPFHAFFGIAVMTSDAIIAENFYHTLSVSWVTDLLHTQYVGGGIAWASGELPLLLVILALAAQWARSDFREARRTDRSADAGLDGELAAYNAMLRSIAERDQAERDRAERDRAGHARSVPDRPGRDPARHNRTGPDQQQEVAQHAPDRR